jgi:hypothetical protein
MRSDDRDEGFRQFAADSSAALLRLAAVEALADRVREGGPRWPILYVMDHTCANVVTPAQRNCDARALSASMRSDLALALAPYASVHFVAGRAEVTQPDLEVINGKPRRS